MFHPFRSAADYLPERFRSGFGRRAVGLGLALLLELGLALLLLTLGRQNERREVVDMGLTTFDVAPPAAQPSPEPETPKAATQPEPTQPATPPKPVPPAETPPPARQPDQVWPWLKLDTREMAQADIGAKPSPSPAPAAPAKPQAAGPADPGAAGDSQRVGTARNGQPLYAASWYREPYPEELRGYLSTADGPGWGLIECQTVADFRVDNCAFLDESPSGSRIGRATLQAAWQFRVRPPRVGGAYKVGAWVRIRIDYQQRQRLE